MKLILFFLVFNSVLTSCSTASKVIKDMDAAASKSKTSSPNTGVKTGASAKAKTFTKPLKLDRNAFVSYAKTLLGTPYKYGSAIPQNGLDCSGFVTCVFGHFNIKAPRSSVDFTNEGTTIELKNAKPGDIILFTGSDNSSGVVGHMGIVTSNGNTTQFIHSSSGKNIGVIINDYSGYYKTHFVKVIRVLE